MSQSSPTLQSRWTKPFFQLSRHAPAELQAHLVAFNHHPLWHRVPSQHIRALFDWIWTHHGRRVDLGSQFQDLFYMQLDYDNTANNDWHCVRVLGRGGFGAVGLFEQWDAMGWVQDEMVVKTTQIRPRFSIGPQVPQLSLEAAFMAQTNQDDQDGLLLLRDFKAGRNAGSQVAGNPTVGSFQWRYYLENCPYGDLERLRVRYKAYGRYLPELFLWHLLYWLARGIQKYKDGFYDDTGFPSWWDVTPENWGDEVYDGYLLHNDIKPQNVFLGEADPDTPMAWYPCIPRLADLGLADLTYPGDPKTKAIRMDKGTPAYKPPEQRWAFLDVNSDFYPVPESLPPLMAGSNRDRKNGHAIHSSANTFAIGLVMYQMMTMQEIHRLATRIDDIMMERRAVPNGGRNCCVASDRSFSTGYPYSDTLKNLIKQCLMLNSRDRISEDGLCVQAHHGYEQALNNLPPAPNEQTGDDGMIDLKARIQAHAAVYFRENEIHNAPLNINESLFGFRDRSRGWWRDMFLDQFMWTPQEWGPLRPPAMPTSLEMPTMWPSAFQQYMAQAWSGTPPARNHGAPSTSGTAQFPVIPGNPQPPTQGQNTNQPGGGKFDPFARSPVPPTQAPTQNPRGNGHGHGHGHGRNHGQGQGQGGGNNSTPPTNQTGFFGPIGQGRPQMAVPILVVNKSAEGSRVYDHHGYDHGVIDTDMENDNNYNNYNCSSSDEEKDEQEMKYIDDVGIALYSTPSPSTELSEAAEEVEEETREDHLTTGLLAEYLNAQTRHAKNKKKEKKKEKEKKNLSSSSSSTSSRITRSKKTDKKKKKNE